PRSRSRYRLRACAREHEGRFPAPDAKPAANAGTPCARWETASRTNRRRGPRKERSRGKPTGWRGAKPLSCCNPTPTKPNPAPASLRARDSGHLIEQQRKIGNRERKRSRLAVECLVADTGRDERLFPIAGSRARRFAPSEPLRPPCRERNP